MEPLALDLERAAQFARGRALGDASATARHLDGAGLESSMSQTAEHELFTEALLSAAKARFAEIKTVTK
jgi:hypothetical protein